MGPRRNLPVGRSVGIKIAGPSFHFLQTGSHSTIHYLYFCVDRQSYSLFNMLQFKLSAIFILAAAAIVPVVAAPTSESSHQPHDQPHQVTGGRPDSDIISAILKTSGMHFVGVTGGTPSLPSLSSGSKRPSNWNTVRERVLA